MIHTSRNTTRGKKNDEDREEDEGREKKKKDEREKDRDVEKDRDRENEEQKGEDFSRNTRFTSQYFFFILNKFGAWKEWIEISHVSQKKGQ